jgi:ribose 5-phosphate isomerase A
MTNTTLDDAKRSAARRALDYARDARVVGLGTGSTTKFAIEGIAELVRGGSGLRGVPTSKATEALAQKLGIPLVALSDVEAIDVTIDGADEVDPAFNMIKGGGGALTREKLVALASRLRVMIVDETKLVEVLGKTRPLPVEVLPFAWTMTARLLAETGCKPVRRESAGDPFITDNGNYIIDCEFVSIPQPREVERTIKLIPGVVESGLFIDIADILVIGLPDSVEVRTRHHQSHR